MIKSEYEKLLKNVEKPGRYTGGEFGEVIKDKSKIKIFEAKNKSLLSSMSIH